jgi:hypothetical protein
MYSERSLLEHKAKKIEMDGLNQRYGPYGTKIPYGPYVPVPPRGYCIYG